MAFGRGILPVFVVDNEPCFHLILRECLNDQVVITASARDFTGAMEAIARLDTRTGIISDLKLTHNGLEGLQILEAAIARGFRKLILFTTTPKEVSVAWLQRHPQVQLVEKTGLDPIRRAVGNWEKVLIS